MNECKIQHARLVDRPTRIDRMASVIRGVYTGHRRVPLHRFWRFVRVALQRERTMRVCPMHAAQNKPYSVLRNKKNNINVSLLEESYITLLYVATRIKLF